MPSAKWCIDPVFLSRHPIPPDKTEICELTTNVNNTLVGALRQLASVCRISERLFADINDECRQLCERSIGLKFRVDRCRQVVDRLNAKAVTVPLGTLNDFMQIDSHHRSANTVDQCMFRLDTRPQCIRDAYLAAGLTPLHIIRSIDSYRDDGRCGSKLFICQPVFGDNGHRKRVNFDIETRRPASLVLPYELPRNVLIERAKTPLCSSHHVILNNNNNKDNNTSSDDQLFGGHNNHNNHNNNSLKRHRQRQVLFSSTETTDSFPFLRDIGIDVDGIYQRLNDDDILDDDNNDDIQVVDDETGGSHDDDDGDHTSRENPLYGLISPEERMQVLSQEFLPSKYIPIDVTGAAFNRMSTMRRSLIHTDFLIKRKKSTAGKGGHKSRVRRRNTIAQGGREAAGGVGGVGAAGAGRSGSGGGHRQRRRSTSSIDFVHTSCQTEFGDESDIYRTGRIVDPKTKSETMSKITSSSAATTTTTMTTITNGDYNNNNKCEDQLHQQSQQQVNNKIKLKAEVHHQYDCRSLDNLSDDQISSSLRHQSVGSNTPEDFSDLTESNDKLIDDDNNNNDTNRHNLIGVRSLNNTTARRLSVRMRGGAAGAKIGTNSDGRSSSGNWSASSSTHASESVSSDNLLLNGGSVGTSSGQQSPLKHHHLPHQLSNSSLGKDSVISDSNTAQTAQTTESETTTTTTTGGLVSASEFSYVVVGGTQSPTPPEPSVRNSVVIRTQNGGGTIDGTAAAAGNKAKYANRDSESWSQFYDRDDSDTITPTPTESTETTSGQLSTETTPQKPLKSVTINTSPPSNASNSVCGGGNSSRRSSISAKNGGAIGDDEVESVYSVDNDGYYTSMHTDSGLFRLPIKLMITPNSSFRLKGKRDSIASVCTIGDISINSILSKTETESSTTTLTNFSGRSSLSSSRRRPRMPPPPPPPRVSSMLHNIRHSIISNKTTTTTTTATTDTISENASTSSRSHSPSPGTVTSESSEQSDFFASSAVHTLKAKTAIDSSGYPSMCAAITSTENSDDCRSGNSSDSGSIGHHQQHHRNHRMTPTRKMLRSKSGTYRGFRIKDIFGFGHSAIKEDIAEPSSSSSPTLTNATTPPHIATIRRPQSPLRFNMYTAGGDGGGHHRVRRFIDKFNANQFHFQDDEDAYHRTPNIVRLNAISSFANDSSSEKISEEVEDPEPNSTTIDGDGHEDKRHSTGSGGSGGGGDHTFKPIVSSGGNISSSNSRPHMKYNYRKCLPSTAKSGLQRQQQQLLPHPMPRNVPIPPVPKTNGAMMSPTDWLSSVHQNNSSNSRPQQQIVPKTNTLSKLLSSGAITTTTAASAVANTSSSSSTAIMTTSDTPDTSVVHHTNYRTTRSAGARVRLDPEGEVIYSSNSLGRRRDGHPMKYQERVDRTAAKALTVAASTAIGGQQQQQQEPMRSSTLPRLSSKTRISSPSPTTSTTTTTPSSVGSVSKQGAVVHMKTNGTSGQIIANTTTASTGTTGAYSVDSNLSQHNKVIRPHHHHQQQQQQQYTSSLLPLDKLSQHQSQHQHRDISSANSQQNNESTASLPARSSSRASCATPVTVNNNNNINSSQQQHHHQHSPNSSSSGGGRCVTPVTIVRTNRSTTPTPAPVLQSISTSNSVSGSSSSSSSSGDNRNSCVQQQQQKLLTNGHHLNETMRTTTTTTCPSLTTTTPTIINRKQSDINGLPSKPIVNGHHHHQQQQQHIKQAVNTTTATSSAPKPAERMSLVLSSPTAMVSPKNNMKTTTTAVNDNKSTDKSDTDGGSGNGSGGNGTLGRRGRLTTEDLLIIIHNSKKKHNIKTEPEIILPNSPPSSRSHSSASNSPPQLASQQQYNGRFTPSLQSPTSPPSRLTPQPLPNVGGGGGTTPDNQRRSWNGSDTTGTTSPTGSQAGSRRSLASDRLGPPKPTTMNDFKRLLSQTRSNSFTSDRMTAAEILRANAKRPLTPVIKCITSFVGSATGGGNKNRVTPSPAPTPTSLLTPNKLSSTNRTTPTMVGSQPPPPPIINSAINSNTPNLVKPRIINGRTGGGGGSTGRGHHHPASYRLDNVVCQPILEDSREDLTDADRRSTKSGHSLATTNGSHHSINSTGSRGNRQSAITVANNYNKVPANPQSTSTWV